jgi:hypothetical protein
LELVDGETLADHIARCRDATRGRGLPLGEVFAVAAQIADALEAAHRRGIVHRDLKPANIKVQADGTVKVLDFGLAAVSPDGAHADIAASTITEIDGGVRAVMGTPAYMSPEQARGEAVDQRTDIWAFGCVLYEMLTGRRAFDGDTTLAVLAEVLEREPDLATLPTDTPPAIRRLLRRALSKDASTRQRDMGEARLEIADAVARVNEDTPQTAAPQRHAHGLRVTLAGVGGGLAAAVVAWFLAPSPAPTAPVSRFAIGIPPAAAVDFSGPVSRHIALSPDGMRLAFPAARGVTIRHRNMLRLETRELGKEAVGLPFFSPDGRWIGYVAGNAIMKASVTGGSAIEVAKVTAGATGTWGPGVIIFADVNGLYRVPENGGPAEQLAVKLGANEQAAFPEVLPGGQAVLFTVLQTRSNTVGTASLAPQARIDAFEFQTGATTTVVRGGGRPRYVPTGHLLYGVSDTLYGVAFDPDTLAARGDPVQLSTEAGSSEFAVSNEGTLAYLSGSNSRERELMWVDRRGGEESLGAPPGDYVYPRLSPDGTRVALDVGGADRDVWVWDIPRRVLERFTNDPAENVIPTWSRDGLRLIFGSSRMGASNVYWQASDGSGEAERLLESSRLQQPVSLAPDGRLLISEAVPGRGRDIVALSLDGSRRVERILAGEATEGVPEVSPDGRWIAYDSNESGQFEVYVRPYPRIDSGRWKISMTGGRQPLWSRDGRELYYRDYDGALMAVPVTLRPTFAVSPPTKINDGSQYLGGGSQLGSRTYDLSLDGSRFLMIKAANPRGATPPTIVVTEHWFQELQARVPGR